MSQALHRAPSRRFRRRPAQAQSQVGDQPRAKPFDAPTVTVQ